MNKKSLDLLGFASYVISLGMESPSYSTKATNIFFARSDRVLRYTREKFRPNKGVKKKLRRRLKSMDGSFG